MLRSMQRLNDVDPGFQPARLLTFGLALPSGTRQEPQAAVRYFEQVKERLAAVPGVQAIAFTSRLPLSGEDHSNTFHLPGEEGFNDGRGATLFPQLPGQTRDPIYNTTLGN
jgi:hypothetical protein